MGILKDIDMAYVAGIMDGDGSFCMVKQSTKANPLYYAYLQCGSWRIVYIEFIKSLFGGSVTVRKPIKCKDGSLGHKLHLWRIRSNHNVKPMLEALIPFLRIKRDRAQYLLDFIHEFPFERGVIMSPEKLQNKERVYLKMISLNDWTSYNATITTKLAKSMSSDDVFWSYLAGLMDTDGSFSVKKQVQNKGTHVVNARYLPVISLSMVDARAINYIRENCSVGKLYIPKNKDCTKGYHYQFGIYTKGDCVAFLEKLIPFLKAKTENAKVLLDFCKNSKNTGYCKAGIPIEELQFRDKCYQNLVSLNKYGVYKSSLIVLETLPGDAEGNKEQAGDTPCSLNAVSEMTSKEDAVL